MTGDRVPHNLSPATTKPQRDDTGAERLLPRHVRICCFVFAIVAVGHAAYTALDYEGCWLDAENHAIFSTAALRNGNALSCLDIRNAFDFRGLDGYCRPRFVEYYANILTFKIRLALWKWVPMHPSFSPIWLLTLIVAPILLYKFIRLSLRSRYLALAGVAFYLCSPGLLSSITFLQQSAKPLAIVATIVALYLAARAKLDAERTRDATSNPRFSLPVGLCIILLFPLFLLTDESSVFCLAVMPLWNVEYFFPRKWSWPNIRVCLCNGVLYSFPAVVLLAVVFAIAPLVCSKAFNLTYDLRGSMAFTQSQCSESKLDFAHFGRHAATLLSAGLVPWQVTGTGFPGENKVLPTPLGVLLVVFAVLLSLVSAGVWRARRFWIPYWKTVVMAFGFIVYMTIVFAHHPGALTLTGYWYGGLFSVFLVIAIVLVIAHLVGRPGWRSWLGIAVIACMAWIQLANFHLFNARWIEMARWKTFWWLCQMPYNPCLESVNLEEMQRLFQKPSPAMQMDDIPKNKRSPAFSTAYWFWRHRDCNQKDWSRSVPLALRDVWLLQELYFLRAAGHIADLAAARLPGREGMVVDEKDSDAADIGWQQAMAFQLAMSRNDSGLTPTGVLPVLACRSPVRGDADVEKFAFAEAHLAYPWNCPRDQWLLPRGVLMLRQMGYTHFLLDTKAIDASVPDTPYWAFHRALVDALKRGALGNLGVQIMDGNGNTSALRIFLVDTIKIGNRSIDVFNISP